MRDPQPHRRGTLIEPPALSCAMVRMNSSNNELEESGWRYHGGLFRDAGPKCQWRGWERRARAEAPVRRDLFLYNSTLSPGRCGSVVEHRPVDQ